MVLIKISLEKNPNWIRNVIPLNGSSFKNLAITLKLPPTACLINGLHQIIIKAMKKRNIE